MTPEWQASWSVFVSDELMMATTGRTRAYDVNRWLQVLEATAGVARAEDALECLATRELLPADWLTSGGRGFHVPADPVALRRTGLVTMQSGGSLPRMHVQGEKPAFALLRGLYMTCEPEGEAFKVSWDVPIAEVDRQYRALAPSDPIRLIAGGYQPGSDWPVELAVRDGGLWPARPAHDVALPDTLRDARMLALWAPEMATAEALVRELRAAMGVPPTTPRWFLANPALFSPPEMALAPPMGDTLTGNGRVYPQALMEREMARFREENDVALDAQRQLDWEILRDLEAAEATTPLTWTRSDALLDANPLLPYVPLQVTMSEVGPDERSRMANDTETGSMWRVRNLRDLLRQMSRGRRRLQGFQRLRDESLADPNYERMVRIMTALRLLGVDYYPVADLLCFYPEGHPV